MFNKTITKTITLTPKRAAEFLKMNIFAGQRNIRPYRIKEYSRKMKEGIFNTAHIAIARNGGGEDGEMLMNGQHTCGAVLDAGVSVDALYEEYECPTPEDTSLLFRQFDNHLVRSLTDMVHVEAMSLKLTWPKQLSTLIVSGLSVDIKGNHDQITKDRKVELLGDSLDFGQFLWELLSDMDGRLVSEGRHMRRSHVIAAIHATWKKNARDSMIFWGQVRDGEELRKNMPAYQVRRFLLEFHVNWGPAAHYGRRASGREIITRCINGWNTFRRKGEQRAMPKYVMSAKIPKAL